MNHRSIVPPDSALYGTLHDAAAKRRCVFFAGLPGVGKSLLLQQISLIAEHIGRRAHLLQWDVSRGPFETPEILARYPEVDGVTHAVIRKAAGLWAREAVGAWQQQHPAPGDLLIGEVPLIGNRLIELVQRHDDAVEPLLASERTLFLIPVPSRAVREVIEAARVREMASPTHERERANAVPSLVQSLWEEVAMVARELGVSPTPQPLRGANIGCATGKGPRGRGAPESSGLRGRAALRADVPPPFAGEGEPARIDGEGGFDPEVYAGVYARLLRHRHAVRLDVTTALPVQASVYDALGTVHELMPSPDEVARVMAEVGARPEADVEREVADWYQV